MTRATNQLFSRLAALTVTALLSAGAAHAQVVGAPLIVNSTGDVTITFAGSTAAYSDDLYLFSPTQSASPLFNNHSSVVGSTVDLGTFTAGTELEFRLHVNDTGDDFFTGPGSRNPDGVGHARVTSNVAPDTTLVEFEDLNGGPYNYNDLSFTFTNLATATNVPEPGSCAMLAGLAVSGSALYRRRRVGRRSRA